MKRVEWSVSDSGCSIAVAARRVRMCYCMERMLMIAPQLSRLMTSRATFVSCFFLVPPLLHPIKKNSLLPTLLPQGLSCIFLAVDLFAPIIT